MLLSKSRCFLVSRTHCHLKTLDIYPSPENSLKNLSTCLRFASQKKFQSMKVLELMQFRIMVFYSVPLNTHCHVFSNRLLCHQVGHELTMLLRMALNFSSLCFYLCVPPHLVCHLSWCTQCGGLNLGLWYASRGPTELQPQPLYCHKIDMYCCYVPIDGSSLWPS